VRVGVAHLLINLSDNVKKGGEPVNTVEQKAQRIVRSYKGSPAASRHLFLSDSKRLAVEGYVPVSESWQPGSYGCVAFLVALVLVVLLIGILLFLYMIIVKPSGILTVTYEFKGAEALLADSGKTCPKCAETVKLAALICRFCSHQFVADVATGVESTPPAPRGQNPKVKPPPE